MVRAIVSIVVPKDGARLVRARVRVRVRVRVPKDGARRARLDTYA